MQYCILKFAIDKDWEFTPTALGNAFVKYVGEPIGDGVQIPGFQTASILAIAIVTVTGIGYSLNRKRKRTLK
ncbi:hypothetical protein LCGC14_0540890 [marine sediment metagenome]|uniref:Uncharacterized protein n=1 Tax=marine sediment metagenome TaxID=412755 RepID=A0A0F9UE80_9ZZZZ